MAHRNGSSWPHRWFVSDEPHRFGSGWISGTIGAVLGLAAAGTAVCLAWPEMATMAALRAHWPDWVRPAALAAAAVAFGLGVVSGCLRRRKTLAVIALGSALATFALSALPPREAGTDPAPRGLAIDAFVLNLLAYSAVFVPLERLWPRRADQPTFRPEWWTDFAWFVASAVFVQLTTFLTLAPGQMLAAVTPLALASLPFVLQLALVVVVADVLQYWIHRTCHRVPLLWRFHEVHHSATTMDWLAGSRLHVVDALLTRGLVYAAIALLGFDLRVVAAYLVLVAAQATFVHANVGWRLGWLEPFAVTPRFHHWHHAESPIDVNFAIHLPWLDRLFGTWHLPHATWPERYGLADGRPGPRGFWRQLLLLRR
ncbi:MAG: sterol desaturase family protein [Planctomycetes bacterium]|nr:sterol desaturase family protein [Planctomycetota bacterium]